MLNEDPPQEPPESDPIQHSTLNIQHSPSFWKKLYVIVLAELALTILAFYLFTKAFE